jgi:uncharacterized repeat protein (TIGR03803 family)
MVDAQRNRRWAAGMVAPILITLAWSMAAPAQAFKTLLSFELLTDGAAPEGILIQGTDGKLYGTTAGSDVDEGAYRFGTVFKITSSGHLTTLYAFCSQAFCADGADPLAGVVQAADGNFYGTANGGGTTDVGIIFKMTPSGTLTTLHSLSQQVGYSSYGTLVQAGNGSFYGTTYYGGANDEGTVFSISPSGVFKTLYTFGTQSRDGGWPEAGLVRASDGSFYGTTSAYLGPGTVFKITPSGALTTVHHFCSEPSCADGAFPNQLVVASDGNFYGTTMEGGGNGWGTVFKMTSAGTLTTLYNFCSKTGCVDGGTPTEGLIQATDGNFYGTTNRGGDAGYGSVFRITLAGELTPLYSFCSQSGCTDGAFPFGLVQDTDGNLYGTTFNGGLDDSCSLGLGCGTIFSLSLGLGPFVETGPTFGKVGAAVKILGTDLTGATSVTFNGAPATFTVQSATFIKTTVPAGATTGPIQVVTPNGTLTSNVNFQVLP